MSFHRRLTWGIGLGSAVLLIGAFLFPGEKPEPTELPWHLSHTPQGQLNVLGLTLGSSTLIDAENRFHEKGEIALFVSQAGQISAEAFFEQINLAGLRSKVVLTLSLNAAETAAMAQRGARSSAIPQGKKITPASDDMMRLRNTPLSSLTLIPGVRVPEDRLIKRFGPPDSKIREKDSEVVHHLYKKFALDIASSPVRGEKQVFQYVSPQNYARLEDPLLRNGGTVIHP